MKKILTDIRSLAAVLMASAAFVACSNDDILNDQTTNTPNDQKFYTMTVEVSKADDVASTRALTLSGNELAATWKAGEVVKVVKDNTIIGELTAQASNDGTTTLTGQIDENNLPSNRETLTFYLHDTLFDYTGQSGLLTNGNEKSIENNYDYDYCTAAVTVDNEKKTISVNGGITFNSPQQAIIKFTLKDKASGNPINADKLTISGSKGQAKWVRKVNMLSLADEGDIDVTPESATNVIFVSLYQPYAYSLTLTATAGAFTYEYDYGGSDKPGTLSMVHGSYYDVTVKMTRKSIDLSKLPSGEFIAQNGEELTGTLNNNQVMVSIAEGATVKLNNVTINGEKELGGGCPGITCLGDATLRCNGTVTVNGYASYPGIYVPEGKTLTLTGGNLYASSAGSGAGIGGGQNLDCGNIVLGSMAKVYATGGTNAAGIGSGANASCGNITVYDIAYYMEATKGSDAPYCIGKGFGSNNSSGIITIGNDNVYYDGSNFTSTQAENALKGTTFTWQP